MSSPAGSGQLGYGQYRVYVYDRGGRTRLGEILPISQLTWSRERDDISSANLHTAGFGQDCCDLLGSIRAMRHELVVYRDSERVWEGPIIRIAYGFDSVEIEAQDAMQYVYRRILREGYDDSYPNIKSVVQRARIIVTDALARDDPNVLPYLQVIESTDPGNPDAKESRKVFPFQKTAWEEIDSLAADAGLDYTVLGRSIVMNDVHHVLGYLPTLDDESFMAHPIVTEYGQELTTFAASTDGQGYYGVAGGIDFYYGLVEVLASSYSETTGPSLSLGPTQAELGASQSAYYEAEAAYAAYPGLSAEEDAQLGAYIAERDDPGTDPDRAAELDALIEPLQTRKDTKADLLVARDQAYADWQAQLALDIEFEQEVTAYINALTSQAERNLSGMNPAPVVVRIPDGSQLNPSVQIRINELIPGLWALLRSGETCRNLSQWQKLDSVRVQVTPQNEEVAVTFSQAPARVTTVAARRLPGMLLPGQRLDDSAYSAITGQTQAAADLLPLLGVTPASAIPWPSGLFVTINGFDFAWDGSRWAPER